MLHLHSKNLYHLNLKTTNILLKKTNTPGTLIWETFPDVKISDIIHQKFNNEIKKSEKIYVPPEAIKYLAGDDTILIDSTKADIYALGIVFL